MSLGNVYLLEENGIAGPIITYGGLVGTVVPPLGRFALNINNGIPGVFPIADVTLPSGGINNVVFTWDGPADAIDLTAVIMRHENGDIHKRTTYVTQGHEVRP